MRRVHTRDRPQKGTGASCYRSPRRTTRAGRRLQHNAQQLCKVSSPLSCLLHRSEAQPLVTAPTQLRPCVGTQSTRTLKTGKAWRVCLNICVLSQHAPYWSETSRRCTKLWCTSCGCCCSCPQLMATFAGLQETRHLPKRTLMRCQHRRSESFRHELLDALL